MSLAPMSGPDWQMLSALVHAGRAILPGLKLIPATGEDELIRADSRGIYERLGTVRPSWLP